MIDPSTANIDTNFFPTVQSETPVCDAAAALEIPRASVIVVLEDHSVVGLVTVSDLVGMVAGGDRSRTTREVMSRAVPAVSPTETVLDAAERIRERGVRHLPVVAGDAYRGVVSGETPSPYLSRHRLDVEPTNGTRSPRRTTRRCPPETDSHHPTETGHTNRIFRSCRKG
ncbi:MAG: putative transcriptional regulator [Natronomonas sp.]|uniref:CBS domain-containing protein n=1 Tax=Natronomonas sp. TaxID=2184060 RepID=UPI00398A123D